MDIFNGLTLAGGLCLFLFGMTLMGQALERRAGGRLRSLLGKMTTGKIAGLLTGLGITAVIQSSSATTVMVVGFVNSGLMSLKQAINVIMGANIGTTVTAWILSLAGIDSTNTLVRLLKPSSFVPVLAVFGIVFYMFCRNEKKKETGTILLAFATLMFGMESMSQAVSGLKHVPGFTNLFTVFRNPLLGVLAGAVLTAIIQSSSASVGILQTLSSTGAVTFGTAIPIIMGQNIGTCVTALLAAVGANKNAKRAALVHLGFNMIGTLVCMTVFIAVRGAFAAQLSDAASPLGIAVMHSVFNIFCTFLMLPMSSLLEKLVLLVIPEEKSPENAVKLDERLLMTPSIALERCREVTVEMAGVAQDAVKASIRMIAADDDSGSAAIAANEEACDNYEDMLGAYLVKLSALPIGTEDSMEAAKLLHLIGDFERLSDHAVDIMRSAQELRSKGLSFSEDAVRELDVIRSAVTEIVDLAVNSFIDGDPDKASAAEPLRQVIDDLKEQLRLDHILRLQQDKCSIELGFIWCDLLTGFERVAAHCANIASCTNNVRMPHETGREQKISSQSYHAQLDHYKKRFALV